MHGNPQKSRMKRRVKWLIHDLEALKPLGEGRVYNFLHLKPRVVAFAVHVRSWGQPCQMEGKEVDVGASPHTRTLGRPRSPRKGLLRPQESMSVSTWIQNGKAFGPQDSSGLRLKFTVCRWSENL